MVKAAMERGVYFEITYSDLIVSVEIRSQMISNAKLLVDWTRGRNLILSSAAPSVYEIRGPYDVMNLTSLLGLSVERAKAALSKNCRNLIVNALKKKHFYKEAIRVELISSDEKSDSKGPLSAAWLKWDPISSGEGDLQLEDIEKSFTATTRVSNSVKPIDFVSIINSIPSHGGNFLTAAKTVEVPANEAAEMPFMATGVSEKLGSNSPSKSKAFDRGTSQELLVPSDDSKTSINSEDIRFPTNNTDEVPKNLNNSNALLPPILTPKHDLQSQKNIISCELNTVMPNEDVMRQTPLEIGLATICAADNEMENISENRDFLSLHVEKSRSSQGSDAVLGAQNVVMGKNMSEMSVRDQEGTSVTENILGREELMESADDMIIFDGNVPFLFTSGDMKVKDSKETMKEAAMEEQEHGDVNLETCKEVAVEEQEHGDVNLETCKEVAVEEQEHRDADLDTPKEVALEEQEHGDVDIQGVLGQDSGFDVKRSSSGANFMLLQEVPIEEQKHEEADSESNCPTLVSSLSGKNNGKHRATRQPLLFPLKRLLNPISFKKKSKKFRHKRKV
ncbi:hypothetical protein JCGZ_05628 [Jatropha curcas]|uniref:Uncharacterized protein n=2 Tax=Jatropha curcas TaxID=180498 RepID=A0A067L6S5_JATCU|nr:uncharacterized protein LOC105628183 isoform X2 [Jatropha curcas]KDP44161.1 hypothetical protein JCGZ_05628 [Jatropha curcas]